MLGLTFSWFDQSGGASRGLGLNHEGKVPRHLLVPRFASEAVGDAANAAVANRTAPRHRSDQDLRRESDEGRGGAKRRAATETSNQVAAPTAVVGLMCCREDPAWKDVARQSPAIAFSHSLGRKLSKSKLRHYRRAGSWRQPRRRPGPATARGLSGPRGCQRFLIRIPKPPANEAPGDRKNSTPAPSSARMMRTS